ncbi:MAG: hypothetical protein L0216_13390 [Planctomycetales bacterium]|nr:hypothetical protein [Planctomycetales bacterium]
MANRTRVAIVSALAGVLGSAALAQDRSRPVQAPPAGTTPDTVYVPYKDLEKVFESEGQGVFLPWKQFQKLWTKDRPPGLAPTLDPPVPAAVTGAEYSGTVDGNVAQFTAAYDVQVLAEKWTTLPLAFGNLALSGVTIGGGPPGALLTTAGGSHAFLAPGAGTYRLEVRFAARVEEKPGLRTISLGVPAAPRSRLDLTIPGADLGVDLEPNLAATVGPGTAAGTTRVLAFLGPAEKIGVTWKPRARPGAARKPLVFAKTDTAVRVEEGAVQARASIAYTILQAPAEAFEVKFPADYQVLSLEGPNVRDWEARTEAGSRIVAVRLHSPVEDTYALTLLLERLARDVTGDVPVPQVEAVGAERERGIVAVGLAPSLSAAVGRSEGLAQADPAEVPKDLLPHLPDGKAALAFRFLGGARSLSLAVSRVLPRVLAETATLLSVTETRLAVRGLLALTVERSGLFAVRVVIPAGYVPQDVGPEAAVEDWRVSPHAEGQLLSVDLRRQTLGSLRLQLHLQRGRDKTAGAADLPVLRVLDAEKETGHLGVALPEGFRATTDEVTLKGFRPVDMAKVVEAGVRAGPGESLALGFVYARHPLGGSVKVEKREAHVTARVHTHLGVEENVLKVRHLVRYTIQYAGVKEFRVSLPATLPAAEVHVEGKDVKEKKPPAPSADGKTNVFAVTLQGDQSGTYDLEVRHEMKLGDLPAGRSVEKAIPELTVLDVFSEDGTIAVTKAANIVLEAKPENLEYVDPRELPGPLQNLGAVVSLRYVAHPTSLALLVTKYDFAKTLATSVNHLHLNVVATNDATLRAECLLEVQNVQRQNLALRMPAGAKVLSVTVAGVERPWSKGGTPDEILVDLSPSGAQPVPRGGAFLVRLRYDGVEGGGLGIGGSLSVETPEILSSETGESAPPVARETLDLYLPVEDLRTLSFSTNMRRGDVPRSVWGWLSRTLGLGEPPREAAVAQEAARRIQSGARAGAGGVTHVLHLPATGRHPFVRMDGGGRVAVRYLAVRAGQGADVVVFLAVLGLAFWLPWKGKVARLPAVATPAVAALLLSAVSEAATPFAWAMTLGAGTAALGWLGQYLLVEMPHARWARWGGGDGDEGPPSTPPAAPPPPPAPPAPPAPPEGR